MRRKVAILGALGLTLGMMWGTPASADHCNPGNIAACPTPVNVNITEGIGNVCSGAAGDISYGAGGSGVDTDEEKYELAYGSTSASSGPQWPNDAPATVAGIPGANLRQLGNTCTFLDGGGSGSNKRALDPSWANEPVSQWRAGNAKQGLYWVGLGPGGVGPTSLVLGGQDFGKQACVSNVGGAGCDVKTVGMLTGGDTLNAAFGKETGAHCGSSHGRVTVTFTSGGTGTPLVTTGWLEWDQSAATILPLYGRVTSSSGPGSGSQSGQAPQIRGFTSARGLSGTGNCGINNPTIGFQVEGISITY